MDDFDEEGDDLLASFCLPNEKEEKSYHHEKTLEEKTTSTVIPEKFPFPFQPYDIQVGFMSELYSCLDQGKIGIFESPTGTGKSLSLICGALKWLKDYQEKQQRELDGLMEEGEVDMKDTESSEKGKNTTSEPDWILEYAQKKEKEDQLQKVKQEQEQIIKKEQKLIEMRKRANRYGKRKRSKLDEEFDDLMKGASIDIQQALKDELKKLDDDESKNSENDDDLVLEEYNSDNEKPRGDNSDSENEDETEEHITKIYYCSRTHSQLSQFVREIMKSPYGEETRVVSLGSRINLCVNEAVRKLRSITLMNDACLDMQKKKNKKVERNNEGESVKKRQNKAGPGCPFYKQDPIQDFSDRMLAEVMDMEEIVKTGKQMKACPYYASRYAIPVAEVVVLPYNTLLHKSTREACGIKLDGNIVVIDEAHNLLETINAVHSMEVTGSQLLRAHSQLTQYEQRYRSRLKAKNLMYIKQILFILTQILKFLGGKPGIQGDKQFVGKPETKLSTINNFLFQSQLENLNLFKVVQYCRKSQISKKLQGFAEKYPDEGVDIKEKKEHESAKSGVSNFLREITQGNILNDPSLEMNGQSVKEQDGIVVMRSPMMLIEGFLSALTNADKDGRIVFNKQSLLSQCVLKFLLLNPAVHFRSVVQESRAVIVAGGTMQPISEFKDQLFHSAGVEPERIMEYSCGHVIPTDHLLAVSMATGPTGLDLDFTYQSRDNPKLLNELGVLISNVCNLVPGGVVCFFPSYEYQRSVQTVWEKSGILMKLGRKKRVFQEPKRANQVDQVLEAYSECIEKSKSTTGLTGAILFCVVGGKMSEGINFSDDLGRCVIMIGMPYPNIKSPELQEKMEYLNTNFKPDSEGRRAGQVHYENLCMKAVNQSIGRAIRHRGDYATILLLDKRYGRPSVVSKLPNWIGKSLIKTEKYGVAISNVSKFFSYKK
ncbi:hypothetical protein FSP39_013288 [Pinctada imbricata]|uniref:Helicase ATP-binding domain-containing protein n=1 Tax=Pinctada imbricata TaxID=66713 RepID=A0AA89CAU5_PINIB|nr:hypothetical protein FSP39_013288 [Pinctada imbricata]